MAVAETPLLHEGPERTCLGCGSRLAKDALVRFVGRSGALVVDLDQHLPGRGAYCCRRASCLKNFVARKGRLTRALRQEILDYGAVAAIVADDFGGELSRVREPCRVKAV